MRLYINEDIHSAKLVVGFSKKISDNIKSIINYNQGNNNINLWIDDIETIKDYISNPSIAFDYRNQSIHFRNGAIMLPFFDWNIAYYVKTNQYNQQAYVYIFKINLKLNEYDLQTPPNLKENKEIFRLKESDLHRMIKECIKNVFKETYYKQYNNRLLENKNRHKDIMPLNRSIPNRYL